MKKQALLIGINEYQILPELKYARQDAEAVEQALKQNYCFSDDEVMLLTDAKPGLFKPSNRRIIEKHLEKLAEQDLDLFIFGFWGHGLFRNGQRYFCPLDAISEDIEELGLSFDSLQRLLSAIRAKNTCMILDCCQKVHDRGDEEVLTAADQAVMENMARDIVLRRKEKEPEFVSNVAILNSCKQGQAAYEWDSRKHGIFTAHLLDAMNRRFDSVAQIVSYISKNVEKTAMELGKTQTPFYKLEGDISLPVDTKSSPLVTGDVFISYRHCNADLVAPIEEELKKRGISYFIDRVGINYGMEYSEALTQAISDCKLLLLFWTPEVKGSDDIVKEVTLAQGLKKTVIPYKIGDFNITEHRRLCYHIAHLSRYEVPTQTPETVAELVNRIEQALTGKMLSSMDNKASIFISQNQMQNSLENSNLLFDVLVREKQKNQKIIEQLQQEASDAFKNENYDFAILKLEEILKLEPKFNEAEDLLSLCKSKKALEKIHNENTKKAEKQKEIEEPNKTETPEFKRNQQNQFQVQQREEQKTLIKEWLLSIATDEKRKVQIKKWLCGIVAVIIGIVLLFYCLIYIVENVRVKRAQDELKQKISRFEPGQFVGERQVITVNDVEFAFRWCPAGTFMMGSPESENGHNDNEIQHQVTLTNGFWMMETEITQKQWKTVMGNNSIKFSDYYFPNFYDNRDDYSRDDFPIENVSWDDCQKFCHNTGLQLPTEGQWEYACRAGSTGAFSGNLDEIANYGGYHLCPVKTKLPNAWGLYDMHGNVSEWCQDWYGDYPSENVTNPTGPSSGLSHVFRGGGCNRGAKMCRSASRNVSAPIGFRCVKNQ